MAKFGTEIVNDDSSVGITTNYGVGRPGFHSRQGKDIILYSTASRRALGPT
jgi:hypothetical protein